MFYLLGRANTANSCCAITTISVIQAAKQNIAFVNITLIQDQHICMHSLKPDIENSMSDALSQKGESCNSEIVTTMQNHKSTTTTVLNRSHGFHFLLLELVIYASISRKMPRGEGIATITLVTKGARTTHINVQWGPR